MVRIVILVVNLVIANAHNFASIDAVVLLQRDARKVDQLRFKDDWLVQFLGQDCTAQSTSWLFDDAQKADQNAVQNCIDTCRQQGFYFATIPSDKNCKCGAKDACDDRSGTANDWRVYGAPASSIELQAKEVEQKLDQVSEEVSNKIKNMENMETRMGALLNDADVNKVQKKLQAEIDGLKYDFGHYKETMVSAINYVNERFSQLQKTLCEDFSLKPGHWYRGPGAT